MKKLIINADDFGLSPGINKAIIKGFKKGVIKEASIMANVPYFEEATNLAKDSPELGIGIHLNLTWGKACSSPKSVSSLINQNNYFRLNARDLFFRSLVGHLRTNEIEAELRSQIEKVLKSGINSFFN